MPPNQPDAEQTIRAMQALITGLHHNNIRLIQLELELLELLGAAGASSMPYRKAHILHSQVLPPLAAGDYEKAAQELDAFLSEWPMHRIMRLLVSYVQPSLRTMIQSEINIANLRQRI